MHLMTGGQTVLETTTQAPPLDAGPKGPENQLDALACEGSSRQNRQRCLEWQPPLITLFAERGVSSGRSFGLSSASYDVRIDQDVVVRPHGFLLASTIERLHLHDDLVGTVRDKSSWAGEGFRCSIRHSILAGADMSRSNWPIFPTLRSQS
jgi:deoxycytidine triphosphate deaminase